MTFRQEVIIILIDKGILALIVVIATFILNWILQRKKARDELLNQITAARVAAYRKLWKITGEFITSRKIDIPMSKRIDVDCKLIKLHLSLRSD
jgi:hypothetical protein